MRNLISASTDVSKKIIYLVIPLIFESNNTNIRFEITKYLIHFHPKINLKFIFHDQLSIENFFSKLKIIFLISCKAVLSIIIGVDSIRPHTYIGRSYRHLTTRNAEHKGIIIGTGQTLSKPLYNILHVHTLQEGHHIILSCIKYYAKLLCKAWIREILQMYKFDNDINVKVCR